MRFRTLRWSGRGPLDPTARSRAARAPSLQCAIARQCRTHRTRADRCARGRVHRYARCTDPFLSLRWLRGLLGSSSSPYPKRERAYGSRARPDTRRQSRRRSRSRWNACTRKRMWRACCAARGPDACVGWAAWDHAAPATTSVRQPLVPVLCPQPQHSHGQTGAGQPRRRCAARRGSQ